MKASELIEILKQNPDAEINIGWEELVIYSELTTASEDRITPIRGIFVSNGAIILSAECYLVGDRIWPEVKREIARG
jgi:hypothetical protein